MAGLQGLDRGAAPSAAKAKQMLDTIGGRWWNVYIGGPSSLASGWSPELVKEYARHGIDRFMITYAGQQAGGALTRAQAAKDARQAIEFARRFGYSGNFPLCLDIEMVTFTREPVKMVEYVRAWCAGVRKAGARPGVYANPAPLEAMAKGKVNADFVWIASWVDHGPRRTTRTQPRACRPGSGPSPASAPGSTPASSAACPARCSASTSTSTSRTSAAWLRRQASSPARLRRSPRATARCARGIEARSWCGSPTGCRSCARARRASPSSTGPAVASTRRPRRR